MKRLLLALICIGIFTSCKKEKPSEPDETPVTPVTPTGNLNGKVYQYDQFGNAYTKGLNTTTVSIDGQTLSAVTDTSGRYTLTNVPTSTYTLIFKKPLAGLIKLENISYKVGDTTTFNTGVADIPTFALHSAYAKDTTWFSGTLGGIFYNASTVPFDNNASVVAIIGKSANIDLKDPSSYINYPTASPLYFQDFNRFFSYSLLKDTYTFKKDSILYIKIYPVAAKASSYFDNTRKAPVYTAYGTPYSTVFTLNVK